MPDLPLIEARIDHAALDRLETIAAEARAQMGEAKWAQYQAEWNA